MYRFWLLAAGAGLAAWAASPARAAGACVDARAIRWIVPNPPGGGYDTYSRLLAPFLEAELGVRIRIDNIPGAGGLRGAAVLGEAAPTGTTLGIVNMPGLLLASMTDATAALARVR